LADGTGRFAPGHRKLGGRKKGDRCKATMMAERLFASNLQSVVRVVVAEAKNARANWACKLVIERILPPAREAPIQFKLGSVKSPLEIPGRIQEVLGLAAAGEISLSDAERICGVLNTLLAAFETADMAQRLEALEAKVEMAEQAPPPNGRRYEMYA
jgi:hypothetical protein